MPAIREFLNEQSCLSTVRDEIDESYIESDNSNCINGVGKASIQEANSFSQKKKRELHGSRR